MTGVQTCALPICDFEEENDFIIYYEFLEKIEEAESVDTQYFWHYIDKDLKDKLVEALINSINFLTTHEIIRRLSKFNSFSNEQIKGLATALLGNSQVHWVADDKDVKEFYELYLKDKSDLFNDDTWLEITEIIFDNEKNKKVDQEIDELFNLIEKKEKENKEFDPRDRKSVV